MGKPSLKPMSHVPPLLRSTASESCFFKQFCHERFSRKKTLNHIIARVFAGIVGVAWAGSLAPIVQQFLAEVERLTVERFPRPEVTCDPRSPIYELRPRSRPQAGADAGIRWLWWHSAKELGLRTRANPLLKIVGKTNKCSFTQGPAVHPKTGWLTLRR